VTLFLPILDPLHPNVSFGDIGIDPPPPCDVTFPENWPFSFEKAAQNTKIWFKILDKISCDTLTNPLSPPYYLVTLSPLMFWKKGFSRDVSPF